VAAGAADRQGTEGAAVKRKLSKRTRDAIAALSDAHFEAGDWRDYEEDAPEYGVMNRTCLRAERELRAAILAEIESAIKVQP
jgi:hypothetical protein